MVGQGILRECLLDPSVESVLSIVRNATGNQNKKLTEIVHRDFHGFSTIEPQLTGYDVCFFALGVSSAGMNEEKYRRITYDITLGTANTLVRLNPTMTFLYISGQGTDSTEKGRTMWARIKGETENALRALPFKAAYMFRPGIIVPRHGIKSKTMAYRILYTLTGPILPLLETSLPKYVTSTEKLGRAMIYAAQHGAPQSILEAPDISRLAENDAASRKRS